MSKLRRYHKPGDAVFVTCVTYERRPILLDHIDCFWQSVDATKEKLPFDLIAWVVMNDHTHLLFSADEPDISEIVKKIKQKFSAAYRSRHGLTSGRIWQHRFYDHIIRDEEDLNRHIDYVHYNPVKHGVSTDPFAYGHSSARKYAEDGLYRPDWGKINFDDEYGE